MILFMEKTQLIQHEGKTIFRMDFTNSNNLQEIQEVIKQSIGYIRRQPAGSVLTITKVEGMHFSNEIKEAFGEFIKGNKPFVKSGAVVGLNGLQKIVYNGLMKVTGRDIRSFDTEIEARNWLAGRN